MCHQTLAVRGRETRSLFSYGALDLLFPFSLFSVQSLQTQKLILLCSSVRERSQVQDFDFFGTTIAFKFVEKRKAIAANCIHIYIRLDRVINVGGVCQHERIIND